MLIRIEPSSGVPITRQIMEQIRTQCAGGNLAPGQPWRQRGILGGAFEGTYRLEGETLIPSITGRAYITAEATLLVDPNDPFRHGIAN